MYQILGENFSGRTGPFPHYFSTVRPIEYEKTKFPKVFAQTQEHLETLRFLVGFAQEQLETHYTFVITIWRHFRPSGLKISEFFQS